MRWGTDDNASPSLSRPLKDTLEPRQAERTAAERLLTRPTRGYNVRPLPLLGIVAGAVLGTWGAVHALTRAAGDADGPDSAAPPAASQPPYIWVDIDDEASR